MQCPFMGNTKRPNANQRKGMDTTSKDRELLYEEEPPLDFAIGASEQEQSLYKMSGSREKNRRITKRD